MCNVKSFAYIIKNAQRIINQFPLSSTACFNTFQLIVLVLQP